MQLGDNRGLGVEWGVMDGFQLREKMNGSRQAGKWTCLASSLVICRRKVPHSSTARNLHRQQRRKLGVVLGSPERIARETKERRPGPQA